MLDEESETDAIRSAVKAEDAKFTDYLNFFELTAVLANNRQLSHDDVLDIFDYYLRCLCRHASVKEYIEDDKKNGFEHLKKLLGKLPADKGRV